MIKFSVEGFALKLVVARAGRPTLLLLVVLAAVGCDRLGQVSSGGGGASRDLVDESSDDGSPEPDAGSVEAQADGTSASDTSGDSGSASAEEDDQGSEAEPDETARRSDEFSLVFEMSHQSCASCGIWFDSAELVIVHSKGEFTARQSGSLLIKEKPYYQGRFDADISSIPTSSEIESATLYMHLNREEGIANDDFTSSIAVYGYIDGDLEYVREITAQDDIKGRGYSKANPVVPVDFTRYAARI